MLERARSMRVGLSAPSTVDRADPLDTSKHLEHIADEHVDDDVTGSSVAAISNFFQVRILHTPAATAIVQTTCTYGPRSDASPVRCYVFMVCCSVLLLSLIHI